MDALETKGRVGLHRWPRESCCTWGDSRFGSSRQLVCDKSKDGNPMTLILIRFLNQPPAARFFCYASRPGGNEGRRKLRRSKPMRFRNGTPLLREWRSSQVDNQTPERQSSGMKVPTRTLDIIAPETATRRRRS